MLGNLGHRKARSLGHPGLPFVEGPELVRLQFHGGSDMQRVQSSRSEHGDMPPPKIGAGLEDLLRLAQYSPYSVDAILLKIRESHMSFAQRYLPAKDMLINSVGEFRAMEGCNHRSWTLNHSPLRFCGMLVHEIKRHQEACVGVNPQ